ncbi:MAG TPA: hypothetical protein VHR67_08545 [Aestuariivirgaceae bacterium]|jgi:hypothetical protein|nr:hypothetical protein [Aestuariivirgaceae bacterium]
MTVKFHVVTVLSYENGRAVQTQSNEIEKVDCTVTNMRGAPVRLLLRFGVTLDEARAALQAFSARLDDLLGSEAGTGGYVA